MNKKDIRLCVLLLSATAVWPQTDRGSIRGTVLDPTGAVIPGVTVTATNLATGVSATTTSTTAGSYNFPSLQSGTYRIGVQQPGFKNLIHANIEVTAAAVIGLDLSLEIGDVGQTVRVTAEAPLLQTQTSSTGTTVDNRAFVDLPLSSGGGRRSNAYLQLVPGYAGSPGGFTDSINGGQASTKEIQLEGASMVTQEITGDGRNVTFPPDAVQEMSVATSGYAAEYGNSGGGVERYVLKSGTNQLHGSAYEFFRNEAFDARGFFNTIRPVHREHEFGGTVSGPVVIPKLYNGTNKTFFFYGFNGYTFDAANATAILSVPTQAFRSGDLSAWPQQIYDPASTARMPDGTTTRQPFSGNLIPANRFDPTSQRILALFPLPDRAGNFNNYSAVVPPNTNKKWTNTVKGDHHFKSSHLLSVSLVTTDNPMDIAGNGLPYPIGGQLSQPFGYKFARTTYDWTASPSVLNQFRVGYNWQRQNVDPATRLDTWPQTLGLKGMELAAGMFPNISWGSLSSTGGSRPYTDRDSETYTVSDALSWTKGAHNFKFGFEARRLDTTYAIQQNNSGLNFSRNQTARPGSLSNTGLEFASFLLGQVDQGLLPLRGDFLPIETTYQAAIYAQDDFKLTPRLTINYGLRFDMFTPTAERHNWYAIVDTTKPNPFAGNLPGVHVFAGQNGVGSRIAPADRNSNNFAPRLGFAYKINDQTAIRSGYGISYFQTGAYGGGNNVSFMSGYWIDNTAASQDQLSPAYTFAQGFPANATVVPPFLSPSLGVGSGVVVNYWDPSAGRAAYSQNWNFNVQRQFASNVSLDLGYVGSKGTHLPARTDINQLHPDYFRLGSSLLNSNINSPAVVAAGYKPPYPGFNGSLAQALRPFPQFPNMFPGGKSSDTTGNSTYHSLQVSLQKRYSGGLFASVAYTFSKALTDAPNNFVNNASVIRNIYDRSMDKTYPSSWRPHVLAIAFNYELPFGPGKLLLGGNRGVLGMIAGGWQVNGILRYQNGSLLGVSAPQTNPLYNGSVGIVGGSPAVAIPQTADIVAGVPMMGSWDGRFDPATDRWLNAGAFALPAGVFGTSRPFIPGLFGPAFLNEDLGLMKKTRISERVGLDIRVEAFNAFNRTRFGNPSTNLGNPQTFGRITSASGQRNGQLAAKITF